jgi:hypothetical protein
MYGTSAAPRRTPLREGLDDDLTTHDGLHRQFVAGLCTCSLRLIQQPDKPGKMPSFQPVYEGVLPWSRIFSSPSSR